MAEAGFTRAPVTEARMDLPRILTWRDAIYSAAKRYDHDPAVIAAIISRETNGRNLVGDKGHGHGPMQIDDRSFPAWCREWVAAGKDARKGIEKGADVLAEKRAVLSRLVPALLLADKDIALRASLAAYNCGEGNVKTILLANRGVPAAKMHSIIDLRTHGKDYSRDVLTRAKVFRENGFGSAEAT